MKTEAYNYTIFELLSKNTKLAKHFISKWNTAIHTSIWGLYKSPSSAKLHSWNTLTNNMSFADRRTARVWGGIYSFTMAYQAEKYHGLCVHTRSHNYLIKDCFAMGEIPKYGETFIAYKYVKGWKDKVITDCIVKLRIPKNAKRIGKYWNKCRASHAIILEVQDMHSGKIYDRKSFDKLSGPFYTGDYRGKRIKAHCFDNDPGDVCLPGIHFFMSKDEAVGYARREIWR